VCVLRAAHARSVCVCALDELENLGGKEGEVWCVGYVLFVLWDV